MHPYVRGVVTFLGVVAAYWVYGLTLGRLIEPSADEMASGFVADEIMNFDRASVVVAPLRPLFPEGSWEVSEPYPLVLEQEKDLKLLLQDYETRDDGTIFVSPCTIIFTPKAVGQSPIVIQAKAAELEFDEALDILNGRLGDFKGGTLQGPVVIRSDMKKPGAEDDLWIEAGDVRLGEDEIYTGQNVRFRLGPNHGRGREMLIRLARSETVESTDDDSIGNLNISGLQEFEMQRLDYLRLQPESTDGEPAHSGESLGRMAIGGDSEDSDLPIEIRCKGPFIFNPIEQKATFEREVTVQRMHPDFPPDQLDCEVLTVLFRRSKAGVQPLSEAEVDDESKTGSAMLDLQPSELIATGSPVRVRMPKDDVEAVGEELVYDCYFKRISLKGERGVRLRQGEDEVVADWVEYESPFGNPVGLINAGGPGEIRGRMGDDPFAGHWGGGLTLHPDGASEHQLEIEGGVTMSYGPFGRLKGDKLQFWFREAPQTSLDDSNTNGDKPRLRLEPARARISDNVDVVSEELDCQVDRLDMWFVQKIAIRGNPYYYGRQSTPGAASPLAGSGPRDGGGSPIGPPSPGGGSRPNPAAQASSPAPQTSEKPKSHFSVKAKVLEMNLLVEDKKPRLDQLAIKGNVWVSETRVAKPEEKPVLLTGQELHASKLSTEKESEMIIVGAVGAPAHFEGRGLGLTGSKICLSQGVNRLWVPGEGQMDLPMDRDLKGEPTKRSDPLIVRWTDRMDFDGVLASFQGDVVAEIDNFEARRRLESAVLEVYMDRKVDFGESDALKDTIASGEGSTARSDSDAPPVNPQRIECPRQVRITSFEFRGRKQTARQHMELSNLTMFVDSGDIESNGPGQVKSAQYGSTSDFAKRSPGAAALMGGDDREEKADDERLWFYGLTFKDQLRGNMERHDVSVLGQVGCIRGPIERWDEEIDDTNIEEIGKDTIIVKSRRMDIAETRLSPEVPPTLEFVALGNVAVIAEEYTARGERMSYSEAKDLLVLVGGQQSDAVVYRQATRDGRPSSTPGRKILFSPGTGWLQVQGGGASEFQLR